jgi:hypothetical protein
LLASGARRSGRESVDEMRAIVCSTLMALIITTAGAQAQGCTPNHELYRIVPEYRAIMLDGGEIKRVMFVDPKDERLTLWKPGHNITYCPADNKMINTTINSVVTLLSEFSTTCNTLLLSNEIDRALENAWKYASQPDGDPSLFVSEAKNRLGWYYEICTDHVDGSSMFKKKDFKDFAGYAASLTKVNMAIEDPPNENTYKQRADKYERWRHDLYEAESKKSLPRRLWERLTAPQ